MVNANMRQSTPTVADDTSSHRSGMEVIESTALVPIAIYYNDRNFHRAARSSSPSTCRQVSHDTVVSDARSSPISKFASRYAGLRG